MEWLLLRMILVVMGTVGISTNTAELTIRGGCDPFGYVILPKECGFCGLWLEKGAYPNTEYDWSVYDGMICNPWCIPAAKQVYTLKFSYEVELCQRCYKEHNAEAQALMDAAWEGFVKTKKAEHQKDRVENREKQRDQELEKLLAQIEELEKRKAELQRR
jgi:hypothetical protein